MANKVLIVSRLSMQPLRLALPKFDAGNAELEMEIHEAGQVHESDAFRLVFETVLRRCTSEGVGPPRIASIGPDHGIARSTASLQPA